jgi:uncharacterized membrane protein
MTTLVTISFPYETTASAAAEEVQRLAHDLVLEADAIAVITRDMAGRFHVTTNHHAVADGPTWGLFWLLLFSMLFFVPSFGMPLGYGVGPLVGRLDDAGLDPAFVLRIRDLLQPGTSALFLALDSRAPASVLQPFDRFGGTTLSTPLSWGAESELQRALHGFPAVPAS